MSVSHQCPVSGLSLSNSVKVMQGFRVGSIKTNYYYREKWLSVDTLKILEINYAVL